MIDKDNTTLIDGAAAPRLGPRGLELSATEHIPRDELALAGRHNAVNALFAVAAAVLQALAGVLGSPKSSSMDLSDIHLIVKRQLANTKLAGGNRWDHVG